MRPPDLDLDAAETLFPRRRGMFDKFLRGEVQPAAFRVIDRYACLRATGQDMKRGPGALAAEVPERHVDGRERQAHGCAHRVGMGVEEETLPDLLHHCRIPPQQPWRHAITQKRHNGGAAGSDRIAVSGAVRSVVRPDADDRCLLLGEGLDCVAAHHLRRQIHLEDLNARNFRHCDGPHISQPAACRISSTVQCGSHQSQELSGTQSPGSVRRTDHLRQSPLPQRRSLRPRFHCPNAPTPTLPAPALLKFHHVRIEFYQLCLLPVPA